MVDNDIDLTDPNIRLPWEENIPSDNDIPSEEIPVPETLPKPKAKGKAKAKPQGEPKPKAPGEPKKAKEKAAPKPKPEPKPKTAKPAPKAPAEKIKAPKKAKKPEPPKKAKKPEPPKKAKKPEPPKKAPQTQDQVGAAAEAALPKKRPGRPRNTDGFGEAKFPGDQHVCTNPACGHVGPIDDFGVRRMPSKGEIKLYKQPWCRVCRAKSSQASKEKAAQR